MKYGINQNGLSKVCANCGKQVKDENFCQYCGAPLRISAIASYEENNEQIVKNVINALSKIAKDNNTDSFKDILRVFND